MQTRRFSKIKVGPLVARLRSGGTRSSLLVAFFLLAAAGANLTAQVPSENPSPHLDPVYGVRRIDTPGIPPGDCAQCHIMHEDEFGGPPEVGLLFTENSNDLCYTVGGAGPCHQAMPNNYPADENSRIPTGFPDAGYFEYNAGGVKIHGAEYRNRWPGAAVFDNPSLAGGNNFFSPHRNDPNMPRLDPQGRGSCLNCHDPHESDNPFDLLTAEYRGIGGYTSPTYPAEYTLCFNCHSSFGPPGLKMTGRRIADYYDRSINPESGGHRINFSQDVAMSWPPHIQQGDALPCYDCHNPHGSQGYNGQGPNAYLISDERPEWYDLTDTKTNDEQGRRFCLGCHIPSDGIPGSKTVEGIVMNTIPDEDGHQTADTRGCFRCHGSDYSSSTSSNVHNIVSRSESGTVEPRIEP